MVMVLSGTVMRPCRADEHNFCQRALNLHDELQCSPDLISKTFRLLNTPSSLSPVSK